MKLIVAKGKNIKGSERKARIPAKIVKGMKAVEAISILKYMPKRMGHDVLKVLNSAISNATHNFKIDADNLLIRNVRVDKSMRLKRVEYKAKGSTAIKQKPFCHITVELEDITQRNEAAEKPKKEEKKSEVKVPAKEKKVAKSPIKKPKTSKKVAK